MKYLICERYLVPVYNKKKEIVRYDTKCREESHHTSQRALDLAFEKCKKKNIYKVLIPEDIGIGYKFYNNEGQFFGEIVNEDKRVWYIKRPKDVDLMDCMVLQKDHVEQKFIDEYFKVVEGINED